jgi:hypothetical protein
VLQRFRRFSRLRAIALAAVVTAAMMQSVAPSGSTDLDRARAAGASRLLRPAGSAGSFRPSRVTVLGHRIVLNRFAANGNEKEVVSVDPATGAATVVARHLHEPTILLSDDDVTIVVEPLLENGPEIVVCDSRTGGELNRLRIDRVPDTATVIGQQLLLATSNKEFQPWLAVERIDLATRSPAISHQLWNVPRWGRPVFWKDRIVLVAPGAVEIYDQQLELIRSVPAPSNEIYASSFCGTLEPQVFGDRLVYQISCGRIVVFDLARLAVVHQFERFDPSRGLSLDVAGDLLFAVPTSDEQKPNNGAVFDLAAGRRIAVLPLTADAIAVRGDALAALAPRPVDDTNGAQPILLYRVAQDELVDGAQERALDAAYAHAKAVLARSGSFEDAVDALESVATDRLFDVGALGPNLRALAFDYAAWLSATLDRRADGIKLLDPFAAGGFDAARANHRLGAALLRDHLLTGSAASLARAQGLLADRPGLPRVQAAPAPIARRAPIDSGALPPRIAFWRDKIVVGRWQGAGRGPAISVYDRATLAPLWSQDLPDTTDRDEIEGLTFDDDRILAWLSPTDSDESRVAVVDVRSRTVRLRTVRAAVEIVLQTSKGVVGCSMVRLHCALVDPRTLRVTARFDCDPMYLAGQESVDQRVLRRLVAASCHPDVPGEMVALSPRWMMTRQGVWPGPHPVSYRSLQDRSGWRKGDLAMLRNSDAQIPLTRDEAIVDNQRPESHAFIRLDFATGSATTLFRLDNPQATNVAWVVTDRMLIVGIGHDLILYDLARKAMAGVLRDVVAETFKNNGHGVDNAKIVRLLIDGPRLLVLTFDGQYSRVLQMRDVSEYATQAVRSFQSIDAMLRE